MTFLHKLAQRLARMTTPILMGVVLTTACEQIAAGPTGTGTGGGAQEPVVEVAVAWVSVTPGAVAATTGQTVQLTAIPRDANGVPLLGRGITWRSSNAAIVSVNTNGLATGAPAGSATITATIEGKSGNAAITITQTPLPVASVSLTPTVTSVAAGYTVQLTASPKDASGNVLVGRVITWSSSNPAVAALIGSGLVNGVAPGSATITATSEGRTGTAAVTVAAPPPPGAAWPNEPTGMTLLSDLDWSSTIPTGEAQAMGGGWFINNGHSSPAGDVTRTSDPTMPLPYVSKWPYPVGFPGGIAPGTAYFSFPPGHGNEVYVGFWWKASNPWQGHNSNINKLVFIYTDGGSGPRPAFIPEMYGPPGGPYGLRTSIHNLAASEPRNWAEPNVGDGTLIPGIWYRIELYAKHGTSPTSNNGILKQWVNGVLVTSYSDLNYSLNAFNCMEISPTWGGVTDVKTQADFFLYGPLHISGK